MNLIVLIDTTNFSQTHCQIADAHSNDAKDKTGKPDTLHLPPATATQTASLPAHPKTPRFRSFETLKYGLT